MRYYNMKTFSAETDPQAFMVNMARKYADGSEVRSF
jgi:hypothetical protein